MDIIDRELDIPSSKSFQTAPFSTEEDMVLNLKEIDRMKTSVNPCLRGGAGKKVIIFYLLLSQILQLLNMLTVS